MAMGIDKYNAECKSIVTRYCKEWEITVNRLGRWIDFKNDYKTMEPWYMESVWWVFSEIHKKGLVYQGFRVMPYSTTCNTPLSNFEANLNYQEVSDPAVIVSFPLEEDLDTSIIIWTTTPWTLPSNLAVCVHADFTYIKLKDTATGKVYILSENRIVSLYPNYGTKKFKEGQFTIEGKMKGSELVGKRYVPLFDYYKQWSAERKNCAWRIIADNYVTDDSGTGAVHQAPAFGEDDYRACLVNGIVFKGDDLPCPVDQVKYFDVSIGLYFYSIFY
jgi:isoleucyl-tRNA synthetase